jgi:hypothetical protein
MLEVEKRPKTATNLEKPVERKTEDIIVTKYETVVTYENGAKIERRKPKKVNVTKLVNETKKLIKMQTAEEKLAELEKVFTK